MAHEITSDDQVISARNITPWHGLGEIKESFDINDLYRIMGWKVEKIALQTVTGLKTNGFATVRMNQDDSNQIVLSTTLTKNYKILQNHQLIDTVKPFVEQGCMIETAGTLKQGQKVWILLRLSSNIFVSANDEIKTFILVSNDHSGKNAAQIGTVAIRVVCNNTLTQAHSSDTSNLVKIYHKGDVAGNMDFVASTLDHFNGQFKVYGEQLQKLAGQSITLEQLQAYTRQCFKEMINMDNEKKITDKVEAVFNNEIESAKGSVYGAYQAVNWYINHNKDSNLDTKLNSLIYGQKRMLDQRAFKLALDLA